MDDPKSNQQSMIATWLQDMWKYHRRTIVLPKAAWAFVL